jgi:hypothetical protein
MMVCNIRHLGYPPPDEKVRDFLTPFEQPHKDMEKRSYNRACNFLCSMLIHTKKKIEELGGESKDRIERFREFMSKGQTYHSVGDNRKKFYHEVVNQAEEVRRILVVNLHPYK